MKTLPVAVQVYSVREDAERDFAGTMKKIKEMGYDGVELAGLYGLTPKEVKAAIEDAGLVALSAHVPFQELVADMEGTIAQYVEIGVKFIAIPYLMEEDRPGTPKFEGNVKLFASGCSIEELAPEDCRVLPKATVQVAQPVALSARLCDHPACGCEPYCRIPEGICQRYGGDFEACTPKNAVYVTIGLFTIVQIVRNVQMLIPAYDFCVPEKECVASSDNPCELFRRIDFPTDEFFPPKATDLPGGCR